MLCERVSRMLQLTANQLPTNADSFSKARQTCQLSGHISQIARLEYSIACFGAK